MGRPYPKVIQRGKSRKQLIKECDRLFSLLVRQAAADHHGLTGCATCNTRPKPWRQMQCGHYRSRRFLNTRWVAHNAAVQCGRCNAFGPNDDPVPGAPVKMAAYLDACYGEGTAQRMVEASNVRWNPIAYQLEALRQELLGLLQNGRYLTK